jgi:hypothetical protein
MYSSIFEINFFHISVDNQKHNTTELSELFCMTKHLPVL